MTQITNNTHQLTKFNYLSRNLTNNKLHQKISDEVYYWLNSKGSLTALLEEKAGQPLRVKRAFEGYHLLTLNQKKKFNIKGVKLNRPMMAWIREVLLYGNEDNPWVSAQSIFPLTSLQGEAKRLKNLKNTPIGYVMFKRQKTLPNSREILLTDQGWQRQTLYDWQNRHLLISETFLW